MKYILSKYFRKGASILCLGGSWVVVEVEVGVVVVEVCVCRGVKAVDVQGSLPNPNHP